MSAERQLLVTAVQRMTLDDGSGLRTTVFFKGCPLKCPWCCNPETQSSKPSNFYNEERCAVLRGVNIVVVVMMFLIWKTLVLLVRGNLWANGLLWINLKPKLKRVGIGGSPSPEVSLCYKVKVSVH